MLSFTLSQCWTHFSEHNLIIFLVKWLRIYRSRPLAITPFTYGTSGLDTWWSPACNGPTSSESLDLCGKQNRSSYITYMVQFNIATSAVYLDTSRSKTLCVIAGKNAFTWSSVQLFCRHGSMSFSDNSTNSTRISRVRLRLHAIVISDRQYDLLQHARVSPHVGDLFTIGWIEVV